MRYCRSGLECNRYMGKKCMEKIGLLNLRSSSDGPGGKPGSSEAYAVSAWFRFSRNIEFLFPYLNAVVPHCEFHPKLRFLRLEMEKVLCVLYPDKCIMSPLKDHGHAKVFSEKLVSVLNGILGKKEEIRPRFIPFEQIPVTRIIKILPGTNCGKCGFKTCLAFAAMLSKLKVRPEKCPGLGQPVREQVTYPVMDEHGRPMSHVTFHVNTCKDAFDHDSRNISAMEKPALRPEYGPLSVPFFPGQNSSEIKDSQTSPENMNHPVIPDPLSPRELEVLGQMGQGLTNREIAETLCISPHTVKSHVINIFNKLGVNHRTQAVVWAARQGII